MAKGERLLIYYSKKIVFGKNQQLYIIHYTLLIKATLLGIEPRSKEPESFILSVELQGQIYIESAKIIFFQLGVIFEFLSF